MVRGKEQIGKPVVLAKSGTQVNCVEGLVLDPSESRVTGLLVERDDQYLEARVIPLATLAIEDDRIVIPARHVIGDLDQVANIGCVLQEDAPLSPATRLILLDGTDMGTVRDILFDEKTGTIDCFESISPSLAESLFGSPVLALYDEFKPGIIIHTAVVTQIDYSSSCEDSVDEIDEAAEADEPIFTDSLSDPEMHATMIASRPPTTGAIETTPIKKSLGRVLFDWICDRFVNSRNAPQHQLSQTGRIQRVLGYRARSTVRDAEGRTLIDQGDIITLATINRAEQAGLFTQLLETAGQSRQDAETESSLKGPKALFDSWFPPVM